MPLMHGHVNRPLRHRTPTRRPRQPSSGQVLNVPVDLPTIRQPLGAKIFVPAGICSWACRPRLLWTRYLTIQLGVKSWVAAGMTTLDSTDVADWLYIVIKVQV